MDRMTKFLLGIVAASLVALNLQLAGVSIVSEAQAEFGPNALMMIQRELSSIAVAISGCNLR